MKTEDYYLDLDKVSRIESESERNNIHNYYRDMMCFVHENRISEAKSIMNTLFKAGYLKNTSQEEREEKIEVILG